MVGVALDVVVPVRGVKRLLVRVFVLLIVGTATPPAVGAFVVSISVAQILTMRVPVLPIIPLESVAKRDAAYKIK